MKILLVSANRERSPYPVFPIGLAYLAAPLEAAGHELHALDLCFEKEPDAALKAVLDAFAPGLVIFSLRNIDNVTWPVCRSYLAGVKPLVGLCFGRVPVVVRKSVLLSLCAGPIRPKISRGRTSRLILSRA